MTAAVPAPVLSIVREGPARLCVRAVWPDGRSLAGQSYDADRLAYAPVPADGIVDGVRADLARMGRRHEASAARLAALVASLDAADWTPVREYVARLQSEVVSG